MDYGKFKYESALKARESRKNQAQTVIKEIKLRPKIDPHDYGTKKGHVERFLKAGDKVKVTIMFRGREQSRPELGFRLLQRLAGDVEELGFVETSAKQDGRNMTMVIGPHRRKSEGKAERAPQGDHGAQEARAPQPARASHSQAARAAHDQAVQAARPAPSQPAPAPAPQSEPAEPAPAPAPKSEPAESARAPQSEPARAARPAPSQPARAPRPAPSQPARPPRPAPSQPARPSPSARPSQPAPQGQSAPQPAERAPAARPVPGPRAVAAASATRRANGGQQETRQPGQEVSTS